VAEALARTRSGDVNKSARTHAVPTRRAPPPPTHPVPKERNQDLNKSHVVNTAPVPKERTQQITALIQGADIKHDHSEPLKNVDETGDVCFKSGESTTLYVGKRVTQSSRSDEGRSKGEKRVNGEFSLDECKCRGFEEFREVHHSGVSGNNGIRGGCNGRLELGNQAIIGDNNTVLEIKNESHIGDLGLQERNSGKFRDVEENVEVPAATQRLKSEERMIILKSKAQEESQVVSHVITTKPQEQGTMSFPERSEDNVTEKNASNDHRQQTGTCQEVKTISAEQEDVLRMNKTAVVTKRNLVTEDKQQKIRHSPHILPTGQHKHDSSYTSSSGSRNTVLLIDNSQSKRDNFLSVAQQRSTDNKDLVVNGVVASSCSPLVENLIVELKESSQHRTQLQQHNIKNNGAKEIQNMRENSVNGSGNKTNDFIESLYKKTSQPRIQHSDWFEVDNGKPVRFSSCHITLDDSCPTSSDSSNSESNSSTIDLSRSNSFQYTDCSELSLDINLDCRTQLISQHHHVSVNRRRNMASLQGLPPLPKSLSAINLFESCGGNLHFTPKDQHQQKPEVPTPRGMTKSGSFRQLAQQSCSPGNGGGGGDSGPLRVMPSSSGRGPTPPTPAGNPHQQILHHQHVRSLHQNGDVPPPPIAPRVRKPTGLDAQLAVLRKEMVSSLWYLPCLKVVAVFWVVAPCRLM
jgi:hypothetical protein